MLKGGFRVIQNIYDNEDFFDGYTKIRARQYNYNNLIEQPQFLSMVPVLTGKNVLDIGCGAGDFAAYCVQQGAAAVTGLDVSKNMIALAQSTHQHENLTFIHGAIEHVTLQNETFDVICSSLALHYVEDFDGAIEKVSRALRDNGMLVFSVNHPITLSPIAEEDDWIRNEKGEPTFMKLNAYHDEGKRHMKWIVDDVTFYHRKLSTMINALIKHGLHIAELAEPAPSDEAVKLMPSIRKEKERPCFFFVRAIKK